MSLPWRRGNLSIFFERIVAVLDVSPQFVYDS